MPKRPPTDHGGEEPSKRFCGSQKNLASLAEQIISPEPIFWDRTCGDGLELSQEGILFELGPVQQKEKDLSTKLTLNGHLTYVDIIILKLVDHWTIADKAINEKEFMRYCHYCVNYYAFYVLFSEQLKQQVALAKNKDDVNFGQFLALKTSLENDTKPFMLRRAVFLRFLEKTSRHTGRLREYLNEGKLMRREIRLFENIGKYMRKKATYIGLERASRGFVDELKMKHLVELETQVLKGLASGELSDTSEEHDGHPNYILLEGKMHRIRRPTDEKVHPCILWTKDSPDDDTVTPRKIFGGFIHGLHHHFEVFEEENIFTQAEIQSTTSCVCTKSILNRKRVNARGKMTKALGLHSSFSIPYHMQVPNGTQPDGSRITITNLEPFLEARHFAFLTGFLPEFATRHMTAARNANMLNILGSPKPSTFGTYDYSASSHLDDDMGPSSGWVMKRPKSVQDSTKNFVWVSHRLIVELAEHTQWFWDASSEEHATTTDDFSLPRPKLTNGYIKNHPNSAQWTRVAVITKAVASSFKRATAF